MIIIDKNKRLVRYIRDIDDADCTTDPFDTIAEGAFSFASDVGRLSVSFNGRLVVEKKAFEKCNDLAAVKAHQIDDASDDCELLFQHNAFKDCPKLCDIDLQVRENTNIVIESEAFCNCPNLRTLLIDGSDASKVDIHANAFSNCDRNRLMIIVKGKSSNNDRVACFARENGIAYKHMVE
ncbi:MAG TPA: hypothetical protein DCO86_00435 [Spirochaetaceae bacterium]|nr:hypothetical protein [Spirochaetaceae bacterium]